MLSNINHKNVHAFQKSNADRNARRRELYRLMPSEKKEILLARRRAKRAEMRKHNLSKSSMNNNLATASSSNSTMVSVAQSSDLMREPITYNNIFAFTSLGVTYDKELAKNNNGIYTFRVQGQMYHFINDLIPTDKKEKSSIIFL
ncbi:hypothetical protein H5410_049869 [Solanum commersonii]|uniref:Uncharacterized protein n=1 Tax=Solanum commersonii TaxID=4109 RepID=A0A9J5WU13_SOLCO|nr:hypothetical protein H5410_049869 [Solanum commersonii]